MSLAEERQARSVALEKAYVHEVYEQISNTHYPPTDSVPRGRAWPKVRQFLSGLEPGSLVCDVGCGNGKYLNVNPSVFKIGADRCCSLTETAREKEHEVLLCDNLTLPFRDDTFDAVLSVAVVHHFATTERRVGALRELARVLRIGGRLIISVWAMEQRHRKFESQDVLVPWHRPQHLSTPSLELTSTTTTSEEDLPPPYHAYTQTSDSDSCRSAKAGGVVRKRGKNRHKGRSIDPARACSSSPSSSSLSSPNETCYSFVRRALQKLAGGKRGGSGHRPWFLDSWSSCTSKEPPQHRYDPEGCEDGEGDGEDIQDLPIELRRLEDDHEAPQRRQTFACARQATHHEVILNHKSKSLSDILTVGQRSMVRSRSSVPSLGGGVIVEIKPTGSTATLSVGSKPRLVKQKKSMCEEDVEEEGDEATDMRDLVKALPEFKVAHGGQRRYGGVFKQSSMNEELMSTERLREKERVRRNIQKQASLNEELIYRGHPKLDSLRDSIFSASTAKRFQLLKNGLTSKLKSSTTGIEKVAGSSFKNGFVRILQGWKGGEVQPNVRPYQTPSEQVNPRTPPADCKNPNIYDPVKDTVKVGERRHSREDGSDSSKDSSLQSDTSVDSEDSFASVIFVPKPDPPPDPNGVTSPLQVPLQVSPPKSPLPLSPTVKHHSLPTSPRMKQPPMSPTTNPISPTFKQSYKPLPMSKPMSPTILKPASPTLNRSVSLNTPSPVTDEPKLQLQAIVPGSFKKPSVTVQSPIEPPPTIVTELVDQDKEQKQSERLRQIKELLRTRTSSRISGGGSSSRSPFPMVRRSTTLTSNRSEVQTRPTPRLLSLELFNPETDDMDSDSSGVSSPDSVSSVISVFTEHAAQECTTPDEAPTTHTPQATTPTTPLDGTQAAQGSELHKLTTDEKSTKTPPIVTLPSEKLRELEEELKDNHSPPSVSPSSHSLLEAAADVASSLEDAVETVIQSSPRARRKQLALLENADPMGVVGGFSSGVNTWSHHKSEPCEEWNLNVSEAPAKADSISPDSWSGNNSLKTSRRVSPRRRRSKPHTGPEFDEKCHQHLTDFAEKLSEKLLEEIDQYRLQTTLPPVPPRTTFHRRMLTGFPESLEHMNDPYLSKLSEELQDLTKLSADIQERNSYLASINNEPVSNADIPPTITIDSPTQALLSPKVNREDVMKNAVTHSEPTVDNNIKIELDLANSEVVKDIETWTAALRQSSEDVMEELDHIVALEKVDERDEDDLDARFVITPALEDIDTNSVVRSEELLAHDEPILKLRRKSGTLIQDESSSNPSSTRNSSSLASLRPGFSLESSDAGDEQTASGSDGSRRDNSAGKTASTTSLGQESSDAGSERMGSGSDCSRDLRFADRRTARCDGRSSSEEAPPRMMLVRQRTSIQEPPEALTKTESCASSLSGSTSQESLPSDNGGGSITFHRYYHVFKEGELDQLIDKYVENLHIISSYYDHANWCVVAEKVQVWTI